jgi:hypothetical protein
MDIQVDVTLCELEQPRIGRIQRHGMRAYLRAPVEANHFTPTEGRRSIRS